MHAFSRLIGELSMVVSRREVLTGGAAAGVGISVAGVLPSLDGSAAASPGPDGHHGGGPSGGRPFPPLRDDPNGILALPAGFSYKIVTREGETDMSFGQGKTPAFHDGTGVVGAGRNRLTIIQNHELGPFQSQFGVPHIAGTVYDPGAPNAGGCTVITTDGAGRRTVDPDRKHVYLSEDASGPNGLFYRWTAPPGTRLGRGVANQLSDTAGTLAAMQIRMDDGSILPDVAYLTSAQLGRPFTVTWTEVPDRDATSQTVRTQFADGTVTRGKKFEGVWSNNKGAYIVNSFAFGANDLPADATKHDGMVWFYDYSDETITLVTYFPHNPAAESEGPPPRYADLTFDGPDNVTVTPWGTLILAEDGVRASHVLSSVPGGPTYAVARNQLSIGTSNGAPTYSEFTGPTFVPDGKILFVNIQVPGITLAITGPWEKYLR
jgi:secreted PhoX family phosphatase